MVIGPVESHLVVICAWILISTWFYMYVHDLKSSPNFMCVLQCTTYWIHVNSHICIHALILYVYTRVSHVRSCRDTCGYTHLIRMYKRVSYTFIHVLILYLYSRVPHVRSCRDTRGYTHLIRMYKRVSYTFIHALIYTCIHVYTTLGRAGIHRDTHT